MWAKVQSLAVRREVIAAVAGAVGATLGASGSYFVTKKKLEAKYAAIADREIAEARTYFTMHVQDEKPDLEELARNLGYEIPVGDGERILTDEEVAELAAERQGEESDEKPQPKQYHNVFKEKRGVVVPISPDMENRGTSQIYVISLDEYNQNDDDHTQLELSYYAGDDVLSDGSMPIENPEKYVGHDALDRFGHGSGDPNVVLVRNHQMETDWYITKNDGKFIVDVLGLDDPDVLRHEERMRKSRKARGDYE